MGTWHVPFPLFVVGRRMNFCVDLHAVFSVGDLRNVRLYLYLSVSLFELQLPRCILLGHWQSISLTPLSIYLSSAGILVIFLLFLLLCCFVFVFRVTSLFIHYVYWLILDTFGTLYSISAMHFTFHIPHHTYARPRRVV